MCAAEACEEKNKMGVAKVDDAQREVHRLFIRARNTG